MKFRSMGISLPIIFINIVMFLLQQVVNGFTESLLLVSSDIWTRPWILITSMFLHGSPAHLFFNMYVLFLFGPFLESRIGTKRFTIVYFISGIIAAIAASFFYSNALGASGAIMGILGLTIMLYPNLPVLFFFIIPMKLWVAGVIIALIDIIGIFPGVAHAAHLGGLAVGLVYGWLLVRKRKSFRHTFHREDNIVSKSGKKINKKNKAKDKNDISLDDEDIRDYLNNGRL